MHSPTLQPPPHPLPHLPFSQCPLPSFHRTPLPGSALLYVHVCTRDCHPYITIVFYAFASCLLGRGGGVHSSACVGVQKSIPERGILTERAILNTVSVYKREILKVCVACVRECPSPNTLNPKHRVVSCIHTQGGRFCRYPPIVSFR